MFVLFELEELLVDFQIDVADGRAERRMALEMFDESLPGTRRITLGADKGYDTREFVAECRARNVTPHVAQKQHSAIDKRTAGSIAYAIGCACESVSKKSSAG